MDSEDRFTGFKTVSSSFSVALSNHLFASWNKVKVSSIEFTGMTQCISQCFSTFVKTLKRKLITDTANIKVI